MSERETAQWKLAALLKDRTRRAIRDRVRAGESAASVADDYGVPVQFVEVVASWQIFEDDAAALPPGDAPQTCEWRRLPLSESFQPDCQGEAFDFAISEVEVELGAFKHCPYCGKPLTLAPDEPIRPPVEGQTP